MNELELRKLKKLLEELFDQCKKAHYGLAMKKLTLQIVPSIWEKLEEKLKPQSDVGERKK